MIALCQEHRVEHRTKHIALRYFLARELQQRGQLRLAYMATRANAADIFTKALPTACFAFLVWSCDHMFSPTLPMGPAHCLLAARSLPHLRCLAPARPVTCAAMASLRVLAFIHEGHPIQFDTWLDDLQVYLLSDSRDSVSLFDHTSGAAPTPPATADSATRSQWLTRDAAARLAICNKLPDHFLSLDPTVLTIDLLEQHLLAPETSVVAVGAARGTPCTPFFEGYSPTPLAPSYASAAAVDVPGNEDTGAASASAKCCSSKGKSGRDGGGGSGGGGGGSSGGGGGSGGGGNGGSGGGSGGFGGGGGGSDGSGGSGSRGSGGGRTGAQRGGSGGGQRRQQQQRRNETPSPQQLREWFAQRGVSGGSGSCLYVIRTVTVLVTHAGSLIFSTAASPASKKLGEQTLVTRPSAPAGQSCLGIEAAALGSSESVLLCTAPGEVLHTFTLDSGASRSFFCDSTTLTPLPAPVLVRLADPSGGPVLTRSSTVLPCPAVLSGSPSGLHLPSFSTNLVSALGQVAASCSCRLLSQQTLLWHHRLGHPSLPRLRGMHSRLLFSGLSRSLPPLPPSPAPPFLPCIKGRQRAAPHSSSFPPTTAPLQALHMDVWGPAHVSGQGRERYILLVVDDYTQYTTVFPLRSKGQVVDVLIPWIRAVRLQLPKRLCADLPDLRLHSDRGGEFSSDLLRDFCRGEGILQSFTLPESPQQNGIAKRRIGLVIEVARTSMIHAATPHFLWPFAVRYAAHQLNLWPRVSLPETSPTLRWTGKFYHPTSRRLFPSQDVTFDESILFYHPLPGTSPIEVAVGSGGARGAASGASASGGAEPGGVESEGVGSGGAESEGAGSGGAEAGGAEPGGAEPGGAEPKGVQPGGAESEGAECGGADPQGTVSSGGPAGASPRLTPRPEPLSPQQLREWFAQCTRLWSGAAGAGDSAAGDTGAGGAGVIAGAGGNGGAAAAGPGGARTRGTGAAGTGGVGGAGARDATEPGAAGAGGDGAVGTGAGGTERRELASRLDSPVLTGHRVPRPRPPPIPGTHAMALRPFSVPLRVPLLPPLESSLPAIPDPESDRARAASPTVSRLLAIVVTNTSFESTAASALLAELVDFAAACRLDYATALVAESDSASPPFGRGECALGTDVLKDRQEEFECLAAAVPHFVSMLLAREGDPDAPDIPTPRSYAEAITETLVSDRGLTTSSPSPTNPKMTTLRVLLHIAAQRDYELHSLEFNTVFLHGSLHEEIWLCRPPDFAMSFPAGLHLRPWGLLFSTADPSLFLRTDTSLPPFYVLVYIDDLVFATSDIEALTLVKSELLKRQTCTDLGELRTYLGLQITRDRARRTINLTQSHMVHQSRLVRTSELVGCLMYLMTCTRPDLSYPLSLLAHYVAPVPRAWGSCLEDGVQLSSLITQTLLGSSCEAEIYERPMAAQDLRWITYLLTDLGEQSRSPPALYVDNKAMIALCQQHRLEHRTKHIALRYFLARELQQRGQLCLAYVATRANTADIFTKALPPGDHQRFSSVFGLVPTLPHFVTA
ncbi:unnamed protein product [Closterium sp. NIES-53]